jgi:hypothetical protein
VDCHSRQRSCARGLFLFACYWIILILAASAFRFARAHRVAPTMSKRELLKRSKRNIPSLNRIDMGRPLIGIVTGTQFKGCWVSVRFSVIGGRTVSDYVVARSWWPHWPREAGGELPYTELEFEMSRLNARFLPQDASADAIWHRVFD